MQYSNILTRGLLLALVGSAVAGVPQPRKALSTRSECDCDCMAECPGNCQAFGGTAGTQISAGLCILTCTDSCNCGPNETCSIGDQFAEICDDLQGAVGEEAIAIMAIYCAAREIGE